MRTLLPLLLLLTGCPSAPVDDDDATAPLGDDDDSTEPVEDRLLFAFPVAEPWRIDEQVIGFDHDPEDHSDEGPLGGARCLAYDGGGFPACYDGHDASDFILLGGFETMDDGSAQVVAAAPGEVVSIEQDQYDRCHVSGTGVTCDGFPMVANHVILRHEDGTESRYWHLMRDSVVVEVGQQVACGELLALIGSSGNSSMPHLHFEVQVDGVPLDPFAGPASQPESWWREQDGPFGLPGQACQ